MLDDELRAEQELINDILRMASAVEAGRMSGQSPTMWQERRRQIAELRQRVRRMRDQHLGDWRGRRTRVQPD